jgi:hypothetical protein
MSRQEVLIIGFRRMERASCLDRGYHGSMEDVSPIELGDIGSSDISLLLCGQKESPR